MAGNARFHDKLHRTNHHTLSTAGIPDSATDPIASPSNPFQGDFVVNGLLSSSKGLDVLSANYGGDVYCENIYVRDTTYTDFISGMGSETIISDGALTGFGDNTLTLDYGKAIYAKVNNKTAMYIASSNVGIGTTTPHPYGGKIFHIYNDNIDTSSYVYDPIRGYWTSPSCTSMYVQSLSNTAAIRLKSPSYGALQFIDNGTPETYLGAIGMSHTSNKELAFSTGGTLSSIYQTRMIITSAGNVGIGTTTPNERLTIDRNIGFVGTSAHYIKSSYGSDDAFLVFGGTTTATNSYLIHPYYSLSGRDGGSIYADNSFDTILPYQERKIVYGSEQCTRYFLVSGTASNPLALAADANIASIRAFAYSGNNKFNTYGSGGNASIDLRAAGVQTLSNGGGYIVFATMPMNSGNSTGAIERMRITSEGKVGVGTTDPTGITTPFSASGRSVHLYNNTNDGTSTNSNSIFIAESVNRNSYFQAAIGPSNIGGLSVNRSSDASPLGRILIDYTGTTVFQNGNDGLTETMRIISGGNVGIGTSTPTEKLHVVGNVLITGNLSALGDITQINTTIVSTSAMIVDTSGTTDALRITQRGTGNAILVEDDTNPDGTPFVITSGGNVGIGTNNPNSNYGKNLHVYNALPLSDGALANSVVTIESVNRSAYLYIRTSGVGSQGGMQIFNSQTNNQFGGILISNDGATRFTTGSAVTETVRIDPSGNVGIGIINSTEKLHVSGNTLITGNLSALSEIYTINGNSNNWNSVYSTVSSTSANLASTYSVVSSNSAKWNSVYSSVSSNSANWESTKTTVNSNSANWLSGSNTLYFTASSIQTDSLSANVLSANIIRVYQTIHVSVSAVTVDQGTTTTMSINSPSYYFVNVSSAGTADFNLPATNGNNRGMLFYIKNVSPINNEIVHVNNSAGTLLTNGALNGGNGHHIEVVWDGTTWQQISLS